MANSSIQWLLAPIQKNHPILSKLRNFFIWLLLFNYFNYQLQIISIQLQEVDVIQLLANPNFKGIIPETVENILHGIYLRNEHEYLENINHSTIITRPVIQWSTNDVRVRLSEYIIQENFTMIRPSLVDSSVIEMFNYGNYAVWKYKNKSKQSQEFLKTMLDSLYGENESNTALVDKVILNVFLTLISVYSIFFCSLITFLLYCLLLCVEKGPVLHYINSIPLLIFHLLHTGFVIVMIVARANLQNRLQLDNHVLPTLILQLIVLMVYIGLFISSHKTIMHNLTIHARNFSPSSSFYSEIKEIPPISTEKIISTQASVVQLPKTTSQINDKQKQIFEISRRCNTAPLPVQQPPPNTSGATRFISMFRKKAS